MSGKKLLLGLLFGLTACFAAELLPDPLLAVFVKDRRDELKYWQITLKGKKAAAAVKKASCIEFSSGNGLVLVSGRSFRLDADRFRNGNVVFSAAVTGKGEARFSFYCYTSAGKFIRSLRCGSAPFPGAQVPVRPGDMPEGTAFLVPVLTLSGTGCVTKITCGAPTAASFRSLLPGDFSRRPVAERIRLIDGASDHRIPWAVLGLEDTPDDREHQVRFRAAYKLGSFGEAALPAAEDLAAQLKHRNEAVRVHSASALTRLGRGAYPIVEQLLLSNSWGIRLCMANTVRGMPGGTPPELAEHVKWASPPHAVGGPILLPDISFEASKKNALYGWKVEFRDGAEGFHEIVSDRARSGRQSLKLVKTNGKGYILLVSAFPVTVPAGNGKKPWIFRLHYRCADASSNSLLLPRFVKPDGSFQWHDTRFFGGAGWQSQSVLTNTAGPEWGKRLILAGPRRFDQPLRPAVALYGNPVTVYLDDLDFPAREIAFADAGRTYSTPGFTLEEALRRIASRPAAESRIEKTANGRSVLKLNGKTVAPVFMLSFNGALGDYEIFFRDVGIRQPVVTVNMKSSCRYPPFRGISEGGRPDLTPLFEIIESALRKAPDASPVLGINVAFPADFVEKNPEEAYLDAEGRRAYGTDGVVVGFGRTLPAGDVWKWWPSQYSEKAREASGVVIREFLRELAGKPYAKVFSGFFISGGHDGQFFMPFRDYGPAATRAWRKFLRERYGTDDSLRKAWHDSSVTIGTAAVPPESDKTTLPGNWYDPETSRRQIDFKEFEERQIWLNSGYYLELCKAAFKRDVIGFSWCMGGTWSQNFHAIYASKGHDLFTAQPQYHYRSAGYSGGLNMVADSNILHGKLAVSELDLRSWLRGSGYAEIYGMKIGTPLTRRDMRSVMLKEAGRMVSSYQGFWFYDMGNGTFRAPETVALMKTLRETADWVFANAERDAFSPDTVWVTSQRSLFSSVPLGSGKRGNHSSLMTEEMMWALRSSGVYPATMLLEDLMKDGRYKKYKVFVFLNPVDFSEEEHRFIREKLQRNGNTLVWVAGTGYPGGSRDAAENAEAAGIAVRFDPALAETLILREKSSHPLLEGVPENLGVADAYRKRFELGKNDPWRHRLPRWIVTDPQAVTLARYDSGESAAAVRRHRDFTVVFCGVPGSLDPVLFRNIVRAAGAYAVTTPGVVADMNGNFLSLHALKAGRYPVTLPPGRSHLIDAETGREEKDHAVTLDAGESRWFKMK